MATERRPDRLTPLDDWFLAVEDGVDHMHMALVAVLEGPCPTLDELRADLASRLDRVPRYRQRVVRAPFGLTSPVWADDPDFDITNHVRAVGLVTPGDASALDAVVGEVLGEELQRSHPLWDVVVVDGLADGQWAAIIRVHHSLTDGVGGSELTAILVDTTPDAPPPPASTWQPLPAPSGARLVVDGIVRRLDLGPTMRAATGLLRDPRRTGRDALRTVGGLAALARSVPPTPRTVLNGPLGPARTWASAAVPLDRAQVVGAHHGVTLNDVALTAIAGGVTDLLAAHGEPVHGRDLRCLVPVSLRSTERDGVLHNHVAAMVGELPLDVSDPVERLREVHRRMVRLKASHEAEATATVVEMSEHLPHAPIAAMLHVVIAYLHHVGQRSINAVTTNVPGPPIPLWWMGRRILRAYPVTPIGEHARLGVAIHSYGGLLTFGVTADRSSIPDVAPVVTGIERDLALLWQASTDTVGLQGSAR